MLERLADGCPHVLGERDLGLRLEVVGEHPEALVRVDPAAARRRDRLRALEGKAGRVREQVPHRRAGRARGLVEVDDSLLGGDERRERGDRLRHRGEPDDARASPSVSAAPPSDTTPAAANDDRPVLDLAKRLHAARY